MGVFSGRSGLLTGRGGAFNRRGVLGTALAPARSKGGGLSDGGGGAVATVLARQGNGAVTVLSLAQPATLILTRQPNGSVVVSGG
jgi:hypothetical protein